ncbi:MAG: hypothetical protein RIS79_1028 [Verrucomicrobiota bacterium]
MVFFLRAIGAKPKSTTHLMTPRIKLCIGIILNLALFINPLLAQIKPAIAPGTPVMAVKDWQPGKPWTVLREITSKLMNHLRQKEPRGISREALLRLSADASERDLKDAARFWSSPGMFHELEAFQSASDPRALALKEHDGILSADDISRWLNSQDAPDNQDDFDQFLNEGAVAGVGAGFSYLLGEVGPDFFTFPKLPDGSGKYRVEHKVAVMQLLCDDMRRLEAGVAAGYWRRLQSTKVPRSVSGIRASLSVRINSLLQDPEVQQHYRVNRPRLLAEMVGAPAYAINAPYLPNGTDYRTRQNRLYQAIASNFGSSFSVSAFAAGAATSPASVLRRALAAGGSDRFTGVNLLRFAFQYKLQREILGPAIQSPLVTGADLGDDFQRTAPSHYQHILNSAKVACSGETLRLFLRQESTVERAMTRFTEEMSGFTACLTAADYSAVTKDALDSVSTALLEGAVSQIKPAALQAALLDARNEVDPVKVAELVQMMTDLDPETGKDGEGQSLTIDKVIQVFKFVWDNAAKNPTSVLAAMQKAGMHAKAGTLLPNASKMANTGVFHLVSGVFGTIGLIGKVAGKPDSLDSGTKIASTVASSFKITGTMAEASTKYLKNHFEKVTVTNSAGYKIKLTRAGGMAKGVGGLAGAVVGIMTVIIGAQSLGENKMAGALEIVSGALSILESVCSVVDGLAVMWATLSSAKEMIGLALGIAAVFSIGAMVFSVVGAFVSVVSLFIGIIQEVASDNAARKFNDLLQRSPLCAMQKLGLVEIGNYILTSQRPDGVAVLLQKGPVSLALSSRGKPFEEGEEIHVFPTGARTLPGFSYPSLIAPALKIVVSKEQGNLGELYFHVPAEGVGAGADGEYRNQIYCRVIPLGEKPPYGGNQNRVEGPFVTNNCYGVASTSIHLRVDRTPPVIGGTSQEWEAGGGKLLRGSTEPHAIVTLTNDAGQHRGSVQASENGSWQFVTAPFAWNFYNPELWKITATDTLGNSSNAVYYQIDARPAPKPLTLTSVWLNSQGLFPQFLGTGQPGFQVRIITPRREVLGTAIVRQDGAWSNEISSAAAVSYGELPSFTCEILAYDAAGRLVSRLVRTLTKSTSALLGETRYQIR